MNPMGSRFEPSEMKIDKERRLSFGGDTGITKFRGFTILVVMCSVFLILGYAVLYGLFFLVDDNPTVTPFVDVVFITMFGIFNTLLFLYAVIYFSPTVTISKSGVKRTLLWVFEYEISWEAMHEIAVVSVASTSDWIFFSKKEITVKGRAFFDIDRLRLDRRHIFLNTSNMSNRNSKTIFDAIEDHAPKRLKPVKYKNKDAFISK